MSLLLTTARAYWEVGLCPLPRVTGYVEPSSVDRHGEVRPISWGEYKLQRPAWPIVADWFAAGDWATVGLLLLTGSHAQPRADTAAFLQILDLESAAVFEAFYESVTFAGHADILYRCVIERTPSGGAHVGFLCRMIDDRQKRVLAKRAADRKLLIELLQHQPCTVAPTSMQCKPEHPEGVPYRVVQGDWARPLEISAAQRQTLLDCAAAFNEVPDVIRGEGLAFGEGDRPGDRMNTQADVDWWQDLLTKHGWREVSRPGLRAHGVYYFQRPGKVGRQPSATYGKTGPYLYVFSSNAWPFEAEAAYAPFSAYALLEHGGDFPQAAKALAAQGYATPLVSRSPLHWRATYWADLHKSFMHRPLFEDWPLGKGIATRRGTGTGRSHSHDR
jgi:putative DNA primase/helicase